MAVLMQVIAMVGNLKLKKVVTPSTRTYTVLPVVTMVPTREHVSEEVMCA